MSLEQNKALVRRFSEEVTNQGKLDLVYDLNFVQNGPVSIR